jgi:acyl dehydratase
VSVDPERALGAELPLLESRWDQDDVILYHLGVGAGDPPTDPAELRYAYEGDLVVLPSFATVSAFPALAGVGGVPGLEFNPALLLHGEHEVALHRPIPTAASVVHRGRVAELWDKGKAALAVVEVVTTDGTGKELFTNRASLFLRGEGGFGGEPGPPSFSAAPDSEPDVVVTSPTLPQQALLYRLSGDKNPLHADPGFAAMAGFDRPILHGLCSFGMVCKAVVDRALDGDMGRVSGYRARFSGVVYPGETLVTSIWDEGDHLLVTAATAERGKPVISNGLVTLSG